MKIEETNECWGQKTNLCILLRYWHVFNIKHRHQCCGTFDMRPIVSQLMDAYLLACLLTPIHRAPDKFHSFHNICDLFHTLTHTHTPATESKKHTSCFLKIHLIFQIMLRNRPIYTYRNVHTIFYWEKKLQCVQRHTLASVFIQTHTYTHRIVNHNACALICLRNGCERMCVCMLDAKEKPWNVRQWHTTFLNKVPIEYGISFSLIHRSPSSQYTKLEKLENKNILREKWLE